MIIQLSDGPSLNDPLDIAPIHVSYRSESGRVRSMNLSARTDEVQMAIQVLLAYVQDSVAGSQQ